MKEKTLLLSLNERDFIRQCINSKQRIDGRAIYDFRSVRIRFGIEPGSVQVQVGKSRVYVVVSGEIVQPFPERPTEGFFLFNTDFSSMASPSLDKQRAKSSRRGNSQEEIELGRVVGRGLRESRAIDPEALCILAGEKVWSIRVDIRVLDDGGNLIDCAAIGAITALLHFRKPAISIENHQIKVFSAQQREPVPLSVHHMPISVSFALFDLSSSSASSGSSSSSSSSSTLKRGMDDDVDDQLVASLLANNNVRIVADPCWEEEQVMDGRCTITMNKHKEICSIQKAGGLPISPQQFIQCIRIATVKVQELSELVQSALDNQHLLSLVSTSLSLSSTFQTLALSSLADPSSAQALLINGDHTINDQQSSSHQKTDYKDVDHALDVLANDESATSTTTAKSYSQSMNNVTILSSTTTTTMIDSSSSSSSSSSEMSDDDSEEDVTSTLLTTETPHARTSKIRNKDLHEALVDSSAPTATPPPSPTKRSTNNDQIDLSKALITPDSKVTLKKKDQRKKRQRDNK